MKKILNPMLVISIFLLSNSCTKTGIDPAEKTVEEQANERIMDTASYSRWLAARIFNESTEKRYTVVSGIPRTLSADILKNGKVLVFCKIGESYQPVSLPFEHFYLVRLHNGLRITSRRTYFRDQVARITVYDSLIATTFQPNFSIANIPLTYYDCKFRSIIVPPALKSAANRAKINWNDYAAVTTFLNIEP